MQKSDYIIAIDLGTGGVKTVLFDSELNAVFQAFASYETYYPRPGWAEQDPGDWWRSIKANLKKIIQESRIDPGQIAVIGIDAMTPVLVPTDSRGMHLRSAIIWLDRRAAQAQRFINEGLKEDLFRISGNHNDPSNFGPKLMWLRDHDSEVYQKASLFHHANGYIVSRLTGVNCLDKTQCGLTQLCDTKNAQWSDFLIQSCGLDRRKLPEIAESIEIVGSVTQGAAEELGLISGIPVIAGSMDNVAAGLGLGVHKPRQMYVSAGTATNVCLCLDKPLFDPSFHIYSHILPNSWLSVAGVDFGGAGLRWFKEILGNISYPELDTTIEKCSGRQCKPIVFLPYMVGQRAPIWNDDTRGVMFGLDPSMGRGELAKAFMEGNALGVKRIIEIFRNLGYSIKSAKLTGGVTESRVYSQVFADVMGCNVEITSEKDVTTRGIAIAAAMGAGLAPNIDYLINKTATQKHVEAKPERTRYYEDVYELFVELFERLEPCYRKLTELQLKYTDNEET